MILRNLSFQNELNLVEDSAFSMEIDSPRLFGRVVQSFLAMEAGDSPLEQFQLVAEGVVLVPSKWLYVVSDPLQINLNSKKNLSLLHGKIASLLAEDVEKYTEWCCLSAAMCELIDHTVFQMPCAVEAEAELSIVGCIKDMGMHFKTCQTDEAFEQIISLIDFISQFCSEKIVVLCNGNAYLSAEKRMELLKYACYTKVKLLCIDRAPLPPLSENEIRWTIHADFDDEIQKL